MDTVETPTVGLADIEGPSMPLPWGPFFPVLACVRGAF